MTAGTAPDDPRDGWRDDAACLGHPAEWFTGPHEPGDTRRAIEVCTTCPVKHPCLDAALQIDVSADLGIWGGTTPATRRRIRRERIPRRSEMHANPPPTLAVSGPVDSPPMSSGKLALVEDEHGDLVDRTGRVIVFEVHGEPPYMLMIDGEPRARTTSVNDAAGLAARLIAAAGSARRPTKLHVSAQPGNRHTETAPHRRGAPSHIVRRAGGRGRPGARLSQPEREKIALGLAVWRSFAGIARAVR